MTLLPSLKAFPFASPQRGGTAAGWGTTLGLPGERVSHRRGQLIFGGMVRVIVVAKTNGRLVLDGSGVSIPAASLPICGLPVPHRSPLHGRGLAGMAEKS